jgi:uncharacterized membrane protein YoaK (UPF0700 family)
MFRHQGSRRSHAHNRRLAALLSFVAGIVNVCGVLHLGVLTTNVTGHFAFFSEELIVNNYFHAIAFLLYVLAFMFGAFVSNSVMQLKMMPLRLSHFGPIGLEILVLLAVVLITSSGNDQQHLAACFLLFGMGLQNALVTHVSRARVRTTHLTGLFTDLGIELSQILHKRPAAEMKVIRSSINLRLVIITSFFGGCLLGGVFYLDTGIYILLAAVLTLVIALFYDALRYRIYNMRRRMLMQKLRSE